MVKSQDKILHLFFIKNEIFILPPFLAGLILILTRKIAIIIRLVIIKLIKLGLIIIKLLNILYFHKRICIK